MSVCSCDGASASLNQLLSVDFGMGCDGTVLFNDDFHLQVQSAHQRPVERMDTVRLTFGNTVQL